MGCDIHVLIQKRSKTDPKDYWEEFNGECITLPRFYTFFTRLAGVRNNGTVANPPSPKGEPPDIGSYAKSALGRIGGHSHSWATPEEWRQAIGTEPANLYMLDWYVIASILEQYESWGFEARVLYCFDS
jgi:hypothetical protein